MSNAAIARRAGILVALALAASSAQAQLVVMGRQDKGDVLYVVNEANPVLRARLRAEKKDGSWKIIHASNACGYAAVWSATNESERKYFVASGKATSKQAGDEAAAQARAHAKGRKGWYAVIYRHGILNRCETPVGRADDLELPPLEPKERGVIDYMKDVIRKQVTCPPEMSDDGKSARARVRPPYEGPRDRNLPGYEDPDVSRYDPPSCGKPGRGTAVGVRG